MNTTSLTVCHRCCEPFAEADDVLRCSDDGEWTLRMSCRSCGWFGTVDADDDAIDELTLMRELTAHAMRRAADELAADVFGEALAADRILPEDF